MVDVLSFVTVEVLVITGAAGGLVVDCDVVVDVDEDIVVAGCVVIIPPDVSCNAFPASTLPHP